MIQSISGLKAQNAANAAHRDAVLGKVAIGVTDTLDMYVGGMRTFAPLGAVASTISTVGCAGLAIGHGICGIASLVQADDMSEGIEKTTLQSVAIGEFLTGLGFAGLGAGLGLWALPVVGLGMFTTNFCRLSGGAN